MICDRCEEEFFSAEVYLVTSDILRMTPCCRSCGREAERLAMMPHSYMTVAIVSAESVTN